MLTTSHQLVSSYMAKRVAVQDNSRQCTAARLLAEDENSQQVRRWRLEFRQQLLDFFFVLGLEHRPGPHFLARRRWDQSFIHGHG